MQNFEKMKIALTIIFLIISHEIFSQTQILIEPTNLTSIQEYEDSIKSTSKGFQSFNPYYDEDFEDIYEVWTEVLKKPLIYKRNNDNFFPTLHTWYFYDKDSVVKLIKYNWGFANTSIEVNDSIIKNQVLRLRDYKNKYKVEKKNLLRLLGKPNLEDVTKETASYINTKSVWDLPNKRVVINMTVDKKVVEFDSEKVKNTIVIPRSKIEIKILMKE